MAYKVKIGEIAGTRQQPTLPVTVFDSAGADVVYADALAAALNAVPASVLNAPIRVGEVGLNGLSSKAIAFEFSYGRKDGLLLTRKITAATEQKNSYHFFDTIGVFDSSGDVSSQYASLASKLDYAGSAAEFNAGKPIAFDPLRETETLSYVTSLNFVNDTYIRRVEDMVNAGVFNNASFWGHPLGSLQIVAFNAFEQGDGSWSLDFGFGRKEFRTSVAVADGISVPELRGCDHYWPITEDVFEDGSVQPKIKAVIVGQIWELDDFSELNLPWQGNLSTRTNDTSGILTTLYTHDITGSDTIAVYWEGGYRVSANVTGTTTTTITFSSGSGDTLPPAGTKILTAAI